MRYANKVFLRAITKVYLQKMRQYLDEASLYRMRSSNPTIIPWQSQYPKYNTNTQQIVKLPQLQKEEKKEENLTHFKSSAKKSKKKGKEKEMHFINQLHTLFSPKKLRISILRLPLAMLALMGKWA